MHEDISMNDEALKHLGNVLYMLSDLVPDDRTIAFDNALEYYNSVSDKKIVHSRTGYTRLVHKVIVTPKINPLLPDPKIV